MPKVRCSQCGAEHDLSGVEPTFKRPDGFFRVPAGDRERRVSHNDGHCLITSPDGKDLMCFLRVVLRVRVTGEPRPISWGLWVEVDAASYWRVSEIWDDEHQSSEPAFACSVANEIPNYPSTLGLAGSMKLEGPTVRPSLILAASEHPFVIEARGGVHFERALEWRLWAAHA